jgi:hypothetical protein
MLRKPDKQPEADWSNRNQLDDWYECSGRFIWLGKKCFATSSKSQHVWWNSGVLLPYIPLNKLVTSQERKNPDGYCKGGRSRYWKILFQVVWRATIMRLLTLVSWCLQRIIAAAETQRWYYWS